MKVNRKNMKQSKRLYNMKKGNQASIDDAIRRLEEIDETTLRRWADEAHDRYLKRLEDKKKQYENTRDKR